jgi:hypothetical protein
MSVSFRRNQWVANVSANQNGEMECSGDTVLTVPANQIMNDKGWTRGNFLSDELFLAKRVVKELGDCEIVDADGIINSLRDGWIQLLRDNLSPDPAAAVLGEHLNWLRTGKQVGCTIVIRTGSLTTVGQGRARRLPVMGTVEVGNPDFLRFASWWGDKEAYPQVGWDRIECIRFSHFSPTPKTVIEDRAIVQKRLASKHLRADQTR